MILLNECRHLPRIIAWGNSLLLEAHMSKYHPSKRQGCDCAKCQALCKSEPGWFMPEEIPAAAALLNVSIEEFTAQYLQPHAVDDGLITMYSPRQRVDKSCVFFKGGKCSIHEAKPFECRKVFGCEAERRHSKIRDEMVKRVKVFG